MEKENDTAAVLAFLLFLAFAEPVLGYMLWDQALDFDPCNNIFTKVPNKCLKPGAGTVLAGALAVSIGAMIALGGLRALLRDANNRMVNGLLTWFGLWMAVAGLAYAYIGIFEA